MKTIGMIGGMGWVSTVNYYQEINRLIEHRSKGKNAKILLYSLDFSHVLALEQQHKWDDVASLLKDAALRLEYAGAEGIIICSNSAHKVANIVEDALSIPLIHVVDTVAEELKNKQIMKIGLLGTQYILKDTFYANRLRSNGIEVLIPDIPDIEKINKIIYRELARGIKKDESRDYLLALAKTMIDDGAKGIVLGCTELPDIISQTHVSVPIFNTLKIHMNAVSNFILGEK